MELNSRAIHDVVHPTAAFTQPNRYDGPALVSEHGTAAASSTPWLESQLNPKNRVDSLEPPENPLWRIDGCTGLGTQYYAVPLFLDGGPPMRFDVFIPEEAAQPALLRRILDLGAAFHIKDASRVRRLGISRHILRALQHWTLSTGITGPESVTSMYQNLPFGSRIVFENLDLNVHNIRIVVARMYPLERQLVPLSRLANTLGLPRELLPQAIDISGLRVVQQLHDSVCLVRMTTAHSARQQQGDEEDGEGPKLWVMKALTSGTKYLYHELQALLNMEPHPNVIERPTFLVTKYCKFGGKTAVVGFVSHYHAGGSLRDSLPLLRMHGRLRLEDQLRWATQLASAVVHIRERGRMFYPDLRLDNVVLSATSDVVMVDFEQRGVWCEFAAPEVNALEYVRILASDGPTSSASSADDDDDDDARPPPQDAGTSPELDEPVIPGDVRERYAAMLTRYLPAWEELQSREEYAAPPQGYDSYNVPWLCLSDEEQEAAEVYMLGRVLWCLFEGQSAPQPGAVWQSYRLEPDLEFPEFRRTPLGLRGLIDQCTRGRRKGMSRIITRRGSKLILRDTPAGGPQDVERILGVARDWWAEELEVAESFLQMREELKSDGEWPGNYFRRPKLREVLALLQAFKAEAAAQK